MQRHTVNLRPVPREVWTAPAAAIDQLFTEPSAAALTAVLLSLENARLVIVAAWPSVV